jgi:hypothetical protein
MDASVELAGYGHDDCWKKLLIFIFNEFLFKKTSKRAGFPIIRK